MDVPLPVAALLRRARNAKSAKERHDTAYFAWEASVRLGVAARPPVEPSGLALAPLGRWVGALAPACGDAILDAPGALAAYALFAEVGLGKGSAPRSITARRLVDALPPYRNQVIGHGAARAQEFYERAADVLLAGLEAAWEARVFWPPDARLVHVDAAEAGPRLRDLSGPGGAARGAPDAAPPDVAPRRLYLRTPGGFAALHPWLLFHETDLGERVLFFNGRRRSSQFLDYVSGEPLRGKPLAALFPGIEADLAALMGAKADDEREPEKPEDPALFGDYRILGKLGEGGMGVVHLARQESLSRLVALKMLPASAADDAVAAARLRREIAALARADHANVVKILASGESEGAPYYAMELVEGADLAAVARALADGLELDDAVAAAAARARAANADVFAAAGESSAAAAPPAARRRDLARGLAELFRDAARALHHLHEQGIVHRDVKPANLMVTASDHRVVVMDLGLAALADASRSLTRAGGFVGTLRYVAPEQIEGRAGAADRRADVYSLGATFYELFAGRPVFDGVSEARLLAQVLGERPLDPARANPRLPRDLAVILAKTLEKEPARRYDTADALARDLDAFLDGRPIAARPPTLGYVLGLAVRRNKAAAALLTALGLLLVAAPLLVVAVRDRAARAKQAELVADAWLAVNTGRSVRDSVLPLLKAAAPGEPRAHALEIELAFAVNAAQSAARLRPLAWDDPKARRAYFDANFALGDIALEAEQWTLASTAYRNALGTGVDDAAAERAVASVETARRALAEAHEKEVRRWLGEARSGALAARPDGYEDARDALLGLKEAQTVKLLGEALGEVSAALRAALREEYLAAKMPNAEEAARGEQPIEGLEAAIAKIEKGVNRWELDTASNALLVRAERRLFARAHLELPKTSFTANMLGSSLLGPAQRRRVGEGPLLLARLCSDVLGRLEIREGAIAPLAEYIFAERDADRAAQAGIALCRLGGPEAETIVRTGRLRFDNPTGPFWTKTAPFLRRIEGAQLYGESTEDLVGRAIVRRSKGDVDGAIEDCSRAIDIDRNTQGAWATRGLARRAKGDVAGAIEDYSEALRIAPGDLPTRTNRANAHAELGNLEAAIEDCTEVLRRDDRFAQARIVRGSIWLRKGEPDRALEDEARAIEIDPQNPKAWNLRGVAHARKNEISDAISDFSQAIQLDERFVPAWSNRAGARSDQDDYAGAIADATRALELAPGFPEALLARGIAHEERGDLDEAITDLSKVIGIDRGFNGAYYYRGAARAKKGDRAGAIADLERYVDTVPGGTLADSARSALAELRRPEGDRPTTATPTAGP
jgi:serine/threonine protein kinase/Tfp pilus assembly protein PilF